MEDLNLTTVRTGLRKMLVYHDMSTLRGEGLKLHELAARVRPLVRINQEKLKSVLQATERLLKY